MSLRSEPPAAVPQPSRPNDVANITFVQKPRASQSNSFLITTLALNTISWLIILISQAIVAATISNASVRILWFGLVIQSMLLLVVIEIFLNDLTIAYETQIAILASIGTVFAVLGVDANIYAHRPARIAAGAGWLIAAIVNILWIIYFTSPPESPFLRLTESASRPSRRASTPVIEKISRTQDAFPMAPVNAGSLAADPEDQNTLVRDDREPVVFATHGETGQWDLYQPQQGGVAGSVGRSEAAASRQRTSASERALSSGRPDSGSGGDPVTHASPRQLTAPAPAPPPPVEVPNQWQAEALFDYHGSKDDQNELAFKKHDILTITDKTGKWWEAITPEGRAGIAPSNYLRLV